MATVGQWSSFDITNLARGWLENPVTNIGFLIAGQSGGRVETKMTSGDGSPVEQRPRLRLKLIAGPTPTPTATPTPITVEITPEADAHYSQWYPNDNYDEGNLGVRSANVSEAFIRFPLDDIPAGSQALQADLALEIVSRTNENTLHLKVQRLNRTWSEQGLTWLMATETEAWAQSGAAAIPADRAANVYGDVTLADVGSTKIDITGLARAWLEQGAANHGLLLHGESSGYVQYNFASREYQDPVLQPRLILTYRPGGGPAPTATPPPTPTRVPPTATATPSPAPWTAAAPCSTRPTCGAPT